jgi:hypothetical protein
VFTTVQSILAIALLGCGVLMLLTGVVRMVAKGSSRGTLALSLTMAGCVLLVLGTLVLPN